MHRKDATFYDGSINQIAAVPGMDITVGKLTPCLPPDWTVYPLLAQEPSAPYTSTELNGVPYISTNFKFADEIRRISLLSFASFSTFSSWQQPTYNPGAFMWSYPNVGDSGHPSFMLIEGELVLVSQWYTTGGGPNFGYPSVQQALRTVVQSLP